jgi:MFS transporter, ACDE family, multidrug resistance protein
MNAPTTLTRPTVSKFLIVILGFVAFVTSFGAHVVAVNLPVYAKQVGAGLALIGVLIAIYDFAEIFAKPVFGWIADRRGLKATMLVGIAFFSLASVAYLLVPPQLLIVIRFLQGLGAAALSITSAALVAEYFKDGRGAAFGVYNALKGLGYVVGPTIGGAIVWKFNFAMIFVASFAAGALALFLSLLLPKTSARSEFGDTDGDFSPRQIIATLREPKFLVWYAVIVVNMFMVGILFGFLPVYVSSLGYNQLKNGFVLAAATASYLVIQPLAGYVADRFDPARVVLGSLVLSVFSLAVIPFTSGAVLLCTVVIGGIGVGSVWTNTDTIVSNLAEEGRLAATLGAAGSFKELGDMLGPLLIGVLSQLWGLRIGFLGCGVLGLGGIFLIGISRPPQVAKHAE